MCEFLGRVLLSLGWEFRFMVKKLDYRTYLNYRQTENNRKVIKTAKA